MFDINTLLLCEKGLVDESHGNTNVYSLPKDIEVAFWEDKETTIRSWNAVEGRIVVSHIPNDEAILLAKVILAKLEYV